MRNWLRPWAVVILLLPAWLSACSWYVVKGPPPERTRLPVVECTDGYELPVLDTLFGTLGLLLVSSGIYTLNKGNGNGTVPLIIGLGGAGIAGWSAYGGYRDVSACREAKGRRGQALSP